MQKSKGKVGRERVGAEINQSKVIRWEFTHTVQHCPGALFPAETGGAMVHTVRDEAGRRRGGQRKCTIQITIKVQLYIPQETYGALC